jgi:hypothetical protein
MENINTVTDAVIYVIKHYRKGHKFFGNELHADVAKVYKPAGNKYPDTIFRMMRRHCSMDYVVVNRDKSLYQKI